MAVEVPKLIPLANVEQDMIEQVLDRAFGPGRHERTAYKVRDGADWLPALSFAALDSQDMLVATIQAWPVALTDPQGRAHPMIMVGPVAVVPERQGEGFGKALMFALLTAIDEQAPLPQVLIGDPEYYGRLFGFTDEGTGAWQLPGPFERHRLLVRCPNHSVLPRDGTLGPWLG